jgi:Transposase DDE domain
MDADLDTLCTVVYCTADDLLPEPQGNARRRVTDAEVVTLCVAQAIMGIPSDRRFLKVARKRLSHLFPAIPSQPAYFKRRRRLADQLEWLMGMFASQSPGFKDDLLLIDSTPVECARSRETVKRSALADAADYGWCASHSRYFWGFRLHALFALDGTPRALTLASPKRDDREVALTLLKRCNRDGGETVLGDKNYAGRDFASAVSDLDATIVRPRRKDEPGHGPTSHRSDNGSNRSSGPAKTSSPSNATAPAPSQDSENASFNASSPSPPASPSTTNSAAQAEHSSTMSPEPAESLI